MFRLVFGVSGASGMPLARALLRHFSEIPNLELHLIISENSRLVLLEEGGLTAGCLQKYAQTVHDAAALAAPPASGSWLHDGMLVCPCSMSSLAAIANGCGANLLHRAADVALKERRPLVLVPRETPFSLIHLRNMASATEAGAVIMPFMPAFYTNDSSMDAAIKHFAGRVLDQFHIANTLCQRWKETPQNRSNLEREPL